MRPDYCPIANEPCQAMCLDGCKLRQTASEIDTLRAQLEAAQAENKLLIELGNTSMTYLRTELAEAQADRDVWMAEAARLTKEYNVEVQKSVAAQLDAARMDWLEGSGEAHAFCHIGNGDYRYYVHQQTGYKTVREVIDAARAALEGGK